MGIVDIHENYGSEGIDINDADVLAADSEFAMHYTNISGLCVHQLHGIVKDPSSPDKKVDAALYLLRLNQFPNKPR